MNWLRSTVRLAGAAGALAAIAAGAEPGMVFVPGGEFSRGRSHENPDAKLAWYPNPLKDDTPVRKIAVSPFYLDEAEVTNVRWAAFIEKSRRKPPYYWAGGKVMAGKETHPVVNVSWDEADAFCRFEGKRLPTEAEWERASRGLAEEKVFPWGDRAPTAKDARYDALDGPGAVCRFPKNYFGLCDMAGNVWEWVADWYGRDYYAVAPEGNPLGPEKGRYRVVRGGSWFDQPKFLACSYRSWARAGERSPTIGFRCAKGVGGTGRRSAP